MKKTFFYVILGLIISCSAFAQQLDNLTSGIVQEPKVAPKAEPVVQTQPEVTKSSEEETPEEASPTATTPEQKAEINIQAKKRTKGTIRVQTPRERRSFIDALKMLDKKAKRQEAIAAGKTEKEVEKAGDEVETPNVDPLNDREMEKYLFKGVDVNERMPQTDEE